MANVRISELPLAPTLTTQDLIPVVQNGQTYKGTIGEIANLAAGVLTLSVTSPLLSTGGQNPILSIPPANGTTNGYLTATDWTIFNSNANPVYPANQIPYGDGSTTPLFSTTLQYNGTYLKVGAASALGGLTNPVVAFTGNPATTNYVQGYIYNAKVGISSSADFVAYTDNSTDAHGWADVGFTSSTYADPVYTVTGPNEAYLFGSALNSSYTGNLVLATDSTGSANAIQFYTGGFTQAKNAAKLTIDSVGQIGVGMTPNTWASGIKAIEFSYSAIGDSNTGGAYITNTYLNASSNYVYKSNGYGLLYSQSATNGTHVFSTLPTGIAGNTGTPSTVFSLNANGAIGLGSGLSYGTTGQALICGSSTTAPTWGTLGATGGGTGQSSYAVGDILYASTTTALSKLADVATGNALISGGVGVAPSYGKIGLTTHVSGTLAVGNGGTGATATPTNGQLLIGSTSGANFAVASLGTSNGLTTTTGNGTLTIGQANSGGKTSNTAIANTVTYTTGGVTLPSQTAAANTAWRVRAFGQFTAANSATARNAQVACFWGSTQLTAIATTVLTATAQTTQFQVEFILAGTSTTAIWTTGTFLNQTASATALAVNNATSASTTVTSGPQALDLRFSMSVSVAGDSWTIQNVTMERLV